jgi:hypothetical protein
MFVKYITAEWNINLLSLIAPKIYQGYEQLTTVKKILLNIQLQFYGMTYLIILEKYLILISSRIF